MGFSETSASRRCAGPPTPPHQEAAQDSKPECPPAATQTETRSPPSGWCLTSNGAHNAWMCIALVTHLDTGETWWLFPEDAQRLAAGRSMHHEKMHVQEPMMEWLHSVGVALSALPPQEGIAGKQLPWFSPWMQLKLPQGSNGGTRQQCKRWRVALNMSQVETLHISSDVATKFYVVAALHSRTRLVLKGPAGLLPAQVQQLAVLCSGQRLLGPFAHDQFACRDAGGGKHGPQSVFHAFPALAQHRRWSVLIMHAAVTSVMCVAVDRPATMPGSEGAPTLWRLEVWMNNSRQLSNVVVPSTAATLEELLASLFC